MGHPAWRLSVCYACYCMCMLERRLQILLDQARFDRVSAEAARRGASVASVIREAIDRAYPVDADARAAAAASVLAAPDMPVPDARQLRAELDALRGRRA